MTSHNSLIGSPIQGTVQGGTGKTQLAVAFTHALWGARAVDALVWVTATSREAIITGFAQAARTVGAADSALSAEAAADRFISWLAHTRRPWALILDDLVSLTDLENLWPTGMAGQVVITTRLPETVFRAGASRAFSAAVGPRIAPVGGFSRRGVLAYLSAQLTDYPDQRAEALDLGEELDGLPLGLAQAAAVMTVDRLGCREYRGRFGERREHMSAVLAAAEALLQAWPDPGGNADQPGQAQGGYDHPDTIAARASLASAYRRIGKLKDAIALYQRVLADLERTAGADHPDAITAGANLAFAYRSAGQLREAIPAYERVLADRERVQGPDHANTRVARSSLAAAYQQAGRLSDAIHHYEQALADSERYLGPDHPMTRTVRENLETAARA